MSVALYYYLQVKCEGDVGLEDGLAQLEKSIFGLWQKHRGSVLDCYVWQARLGHKGIYLYESVTDVLYSILYKVRLTRQENGVQQKVTATASKETQEANTVMLKWPELIEMCLWFTHPQLFHCMQFVAIVKMDLSLLYVISSRSSLRSLKPVLYNEYLSGSSRGSVNSLLE